MSDDAGRLASPLQVLQVSRPEAGIPTILRLICREGVSRLAVGVPLNMDGSLGPAARAAIAWGRQLQQVAGLPMVYLDERLSSFHAEQELTRRRRAGEKLTRQRKKRRLDAMAAAAFLQAFLDGELAPLAVVPG